MIDCTDVDEENRCMSTTAGIGSSVYLTNVVPVASTGGPAANTNVILAPNSEMVSGAAGANEIETMLQLVWLRFAGVPRELGGGFWQ